MRKLLLPAGILLGGAFGLTFGCGEHGLSTGDQLSLTVTPLTTSSNQSGEASVCGVSQRTGCIPGLGRRAEIAVKALSKESGLDVPEGLVVLLTADQGWLVQTPPEGSKDSDCQQEGRTNQLRLTLAQGAGRATWCFGDAGATATVTANSGTISTSAQLQLGSVPSALQLWASPSSVTDGGTVTFTASVADCQGNGIAGVPILFTADAPGVSWNGNSPVVNSSADGVAELAGSVSATTAPANVSARVLHSPDVSCSLKIGGSP